MESPSSVAKEDVGGRGDIPGFIGGFTRPKAPHRRGRHHDPVIELPDIFSAALALLTFAVFAALVWAGNHQH
jgi:hypothetical protein